MLLGVAFIQATRNASLVFLVAEQSQEEGTGERKGRREGEEGGRERREGEMG